MISAWLHRWFGIHNWEYYCINSKQIEKRQCLICDKKQEREWFYGVGGIFNSKWRNI